MKGLKDKFKEEELLKVDGVPQNKILKLNKFVISELIKPLIKNIVACYEVMWKDYKEITNEPRDELLKDVLIMINQFEKKRIK